MQLVAGSSLYSTTCIYVPWYVPLFRSCTQQRASMCLGMCRYPGIGPSRDSQRQHLADINAYGPKVAAKIQALRLAKQQNRLPAIMQVGLLPNWRCVLAWLPNWRCALAWLPGCVLWIQCSLYDAHHPTLPCPALPYPTLPCARS